MNLSHFIKEVMTVYRRDLPRKSSTPKQREWFLREFPHLDRGRNWNRALYDFNVNSWLAPNSTGICLSLVLFLKEILEEKEEPYEILFLYEVDTFCHAVLKYQGKYYDSFYPDGIEDPKKLVFADLCTLSRPDERVFRNFYDRGPVAFLRENLYDKVYTKFKLEAL